MTWVLFALGAFLIWGQLVAFLRLQREFQRHTIACGAAVGHLEHRIKLLETRTRP